jgi:hypothetical protein
MKRVMKQGWLSKMVFEKLETWIKSVTSCSIRNEKAVCGGRMKKKFIF